MKEIYVDGVRYIEAPVEDVKLTPAERAECAIAAEHILGMCDWEITKEGAVYWNAVYDNLVRMTEHGR